jgi:hypothetical protein
MYPSSDDLDLDLSDKVPGPGDDESPVTELVDDRPSGAIVLELAYGVPMRPHWWSRIWWWIRGVTDAAHLYRHCARCDRYGIEHWRLRGCRRYLRPSRGTSLLS